MNRAALARRHEPTWQRQEELFHGQADFIYRTTDRLFVRLLLFQWVAGIAAALWISPRTWSGAASETHLHVYAAVFLGGLISLPPVALALRYPGRTVTRHAIALAQAATSALLIHLTGGHIETHFHVFGSLAFLAFYRDWRVLVTASAFVAADHMVRGILWPQSMFGVLTTSPWRWLEHTAWVVFEDVFLIRSCILAKREMSKTARQQATLELTKAGIEDQVQQRTSELRAANEELGRNVDEKTRLLDERDSLEVQLRSAQKLEAIGQLAAGIAHEINTPTQYVGDNTRFLKDAFGDILDLVEVYERLVEEASAGSPTEVTLSAVSEAREVADLEYLKTEVPKSIEQSLDGVGRVSSIVLAMKDFSHPGVEDFSQVDLNRCVESTATVCRNEWKYHAIVEFDLDPNLPAVPCLAGEVNQVILNIIVNAAHAIAAAGFDADDQGRIAISTRLKGQFVELRIQDNGTGIPQEIRDRVFDPFFTTKGVGKGTGQGLAIAHTVITQKHRGTIAVESEDGKGSTFVIRLPLEQSEAEQRVA